MKRIIALLLLSVLLLRTAPQLEIGTCIGSIYPDNPYGGRIESINGRPADPVYNYISYRGTAARPGDTVYTLTFYNPFNLDHCDDYILILDYVNNTLTYRK